MLDVVMEDGSTLIVLLLLLSVVCAAGLFGIGKQEEDSSLMDLKPKKSNYKFTHALESMKFTFKWVLKLVVAFQSINQ